MFNDGSSIETDEATGNRTVVGNLAHDEYFKRLAEERNAAECAVVFSCLNADGTRRAEIIRKRVTNPLTRSWLGEYCYETWSCHEPDVVTRHFSEADARLAFNGLRLEGTNP